jgi:hypothetical protein
MLASVVATSTASGSAMSRTPRLMEGSCRSGRRLVRDELTESPSELEDPFAVGSPVVECGEDGERLPSVGGDHAATDDERTLDTRGNVQATNVAVRPKPCRELGGFLGGEGGSAKPNHKTSVGEHVFVF